MEKAIGLMGGTFDPIHYGHLVVAACAADQLSLEKVIFIPAAIPPHKRNRALTDEMQRLEMVRRATEDNPQFEVSAHEMERGGVSYTVDTLRYFKKLYPEHRLYFITGADTLPEIDTWRSPHEMMELAYFVVAVRPGYTLAGLERDFYQQYIERFAFLETPVIGISSTGIRTQVREGRTIRYQVPDAVAEYIYQYKLYQTKQTKEQSLWMKE